MDYGFIRAVVAVLLVATVVLLWCNCGATVVKTTPTAVIVDAVVAVTSSRIA